MYKAVMSVQFVDGVFNLVINGFGKLIILTNLSKLPIK